MKYQQARLKYQFNKLAPLRAGIYPAYGGNIEFELFTFFEVCYHLKDWVKNSSESSTLPDVEIFISNSPSLRICADICNRLKHKDLRKRRSHSEIGVFHIAQSTTVFPLGSTDKSIARIEATIETERGKECCFTLAKECMSEWERYFRRNQSNY